MQKGWQWNGWTWQGMQTVMDITRMDGGPCIPGGTG